jgi:hypothetical protein
VKVDLRGFFLLFISLLSGASILVAPVDKHPGLMIASIFALVAFVLHTWSLNK